MFDMSHLLNPKQKSSNRCGKILIVAVLSLAIPILGWKQPEVKAKQVATSNPWNSAKFPVENFQAYGSPFGYRRSPFGGASTEFHSGLDIVAPQGSYIRNWWAGQVIKVADGDACGTHVVIQSGGWQHVYCHMQGQVGTQGNNRYLLDRQGGIVIWQGQLVAAGARIGRVGMTGRTTGPHLHWGLKYANNYIDPAIVLRAMYQQQVSRRP